MPFVRGIGKLETYNFVDSRSAYFMMACLFASLIAEIFASEGETDKGNTKLQEEHVGKGTEEPAFIADISRSLA